MVKVQFVFTLSPAWPGLPLIPMFPGKPLKEYDRVMSKHQPQVQYS